MINAVWQGILLGLILSVSAGPILFILLQTSVSQGFFRAMFLEVGVVLSDLLIIFLAFFLLGQYLTDNHIQKYILIIGGFILVLYGCWAAFLKNSDKKLSKKLTEEEIQIANELSEKEEVKDNWVVLFLKGFIFNSINPSGIIFWVGAVTLASANYGGEVKYIAVQFGSAVLMMFFFDVIKAFSAYKSKKLFSPKVLQIINKYLGVIFIVFGLVLVLRGLWT